MNTRTHSKSVTDCANLDVRHGAESCIYNDFTSLLNSMHIASMIFTAHPVAGYAVLCYMPFR